MSRQFSASFRKCLLSALSVACIVGVSSGAFAAPVEGCDPRVMRAMAAQMQARVAADVASTSQFIDKPDSVLALTCFNQAAGVSAKAGGEIFSGDFTAELSPIISAALENHYRQFANAAGFDPPGVVDYSATGLSSTFNCHEMQDLWNQTKAEGVQVDVPVATFDDMVSGTPPAGGGEDFNTDWQGAADQGVFTELQSATDELPQPDVPDFSNCKTAADVLALTQSGTPCP